MREAPPVSPTDELGLAGKSFFIGESEKEEPVERLPYAYTLSIDSDIFKLPSYQARHT